MRIVGITLLVITFSCLPIFSQTVIYEDNFDQYTEARVPDRWEKFTSEVHEIDPPTESAIWATMDYSVWINQPDEYNSQRLQHAGDPQKAHEGAHWKSKPGADFTRTGASNRIFVCDTIIPGDGTVDTWVISDPFPIAGYDYVVFSFESYFLGNQDQQASFHYRLDESETWKRILLINDIRYRNDQQYYGPYAFAFHVEGRQSIQFRFQFQGTWSWLWAMDKFKLVGFNGTPPGPQKADALQPIGNVPYNNVTLQSSAYAGDGTHVFSQWQIRQANGSYGDMIHEEFDIDYIAWIETDPILDTAFQPTVYSEEEDSFIRYDLQGDQTQFVVRKELLRPGMEYYWRVRHWNNQGQAGPWSDEVQFIVEDIEGYDLLFEDFDAVPEGEAPEGWILENIDSFGDGDFGAVGMTRPRHRWADLIHNSNKDLWADGSGRHGGFRGNVSWVAAWAHNVNDTIFRTKSLDFSNATGGRIIFDSNFKGVGKAFIDVVINEGDPINVHSFGPNHLEDAVRQSVEVINLPPTVAGQSDVRIQFRCNKSSGSWTFDNVRVQASSDITFVDQPKITAPPASISYTPGFITITASAFSDPEGGIHAETHWQLARAYKGFMFPIADRKKTEGDLTSFQIENLAPGHDYIVRVKYHTEDGRESPWSLMHTFRVDAPNNGTLLLSEDFDAQEGQSNPEGWSQNNSNTLGGYDEFNGWSYLTLEFFESYQQGRSNSPYFAGRIVDADSDEYDMNNNGFNSELLSPVIETAGEPLLLVFDTLYQHWPTQIAELNYSLNGGDTFQNLFRWDQSNFVQDQRREHPVIELIPGSENTSHIQFMWKLYGIEGDEGNLAINDWWWAIDHVRIYAITEDVSIEDWMLH